MYTWSQTPDLFTTADVTVASLPSYLCSPSTIMKHPEMDRTVLFHLGALDKYASGWVGGIHPIAKSKVVRTVLSCYTEPSQSVFAKACHCTNFANLQTCLVAISLGFLLLR